MKLINSFTMYIYFICLGNLYRKKEVPIRDTEEAVAESLVRSSLEIQQPVSL